VDHVVVMALREALVHVDPQKVLAEAMDYFMAHEGAGHVVDALAKRRETGRWPDA
jgi:hypothetical protein